MNQLPTADAEAIEAEFAARLSQCSDATPAQPLSQTTDDHASQTRCTEPVAVIAISKPVRERIATNWQNASDARHLKST